MPRPDEPTYAERLSRGTGLRPQRILDDPTAKVDEADVAAAPPDERPGLELARQRGELICGRITAHTLKPRESSPDFAPAVPFVTAFAGILGAAETVKRLMGYRYPLSLHYQYDFRSSRGRALGMACDPSCECRLAMTGNSAGRQL